MNKLTLDKNKKNNSRFLNLYQKKEDPVGMAHWSLEEAINNRRENVYREPESGIIIQIQRNATGDFTILKVKEF